LQYSKYWQAKCQKNPTILEPKHHSFKINQEIEESVWYMHLKIENTCLKTYVKIHVDEKVYENMYNII